MCEMAKRQSVVDVFHAVKTLRNSKPNMVDTPVSYRDTETVRGTDVWFGVLTAFKYIYKDTNVTFYIKGHLFAHQLISNIVALCYSY